MVRSGHNPVGSRTIALATNDAWNVINYRRGLVQALQDHGYRVAVLAPSDSRASEIARMGAEFHEVPTDPRGLSPSGDLRTLMAFHQVLRRIRPAAVLGFTIKPNVYGSIAARFLGIPVINNISGLGTVFTRETMLTRLVEMLYRFALARSATVFFQNRDDAQLFVARRLVRPRQFRIIPGSGVDLSRFAPTEQSSEHERFTYLFVGRLLWAKGLGELADAARLLKREGENVQIKVAGIASGTSSDAVTPATLAEWESESLIDYVGAVDDVRPLVAEADCMILPSYYREGVPRALLEAGAMGKPAITTDWPGCREAVDDGITGYLCEPRSPSSLAEAMRRMMRLDSGARKAMGRAARQKMERQFSEEVVIAAYLYALGELAPPRS